MRVAIIGVVLVGCTAPSVVVTDPPREVRVESFDPALRFYWDPLRPARAENTADSIASTPDDVDVLCVTNVRFAADRDAILAKARTRWPHIGFVATNAETPIEDPRDYKGGAQTVDMSAACSGGDVDLVKQKRDCVQATCVDVTGHESLSCLIDNCKLAVPSSPRCAACLEDAITNGPIEAVEKRCTVDPRGELFDEGQLSAMIFSRHPLSEVTAHMFPATVAPRGALTARVDAPRPFFVSCNATLAWIPSVQYFGPFAPHDGSGWNVESSTALSRAIEVAHALGERGPSVILGGPMTLWSTNKKHQTNNTLEWEWLRTNFDPFVSPDLERESGEPLCTACFRENPVTPLARYAADHNEFAEMLFGTGARFDVRDIAITRTEAAYTLEGRLMPVGPFYGASARFSW